VRKKFLFLYMTSEMNEGATLIAQGSPGHEPGDPAREATSAIIYDGLYRKSTLRLPPVFEPEGLLRVDPERRSPAPPSNAGLGAVLRVKFRYRGSIR